MLVKKVYSSNDQSKVYLRFKKPLLCFRQTSPDYAEALLKKMWRRVYEF